MTERELYMCCANWEYITDEHLQKNIERVKVILSGDINVNDTGGRDNLMTALTHSCQGDSRNIEITKLLLAHPNIEVDKPDIYGNTPIIMACAWNNLDAIIILLKTGKVDVNHKNNDGASPLWAACSNGSISIAEYLLAHTNLDFTVKSKYLFGDKKYSALEISRHLGHKELVTLLEEFEVDEEVAKRRLRRKHGIGNGYDAAQIFLLCTLHSDKYLKLKSPSMMLRFFNFVKRIRTKPSVIPRFFDLMKRLPKEIQMIICNRLFSIYKKDFISSASIGLELRILRLENFFV